MSGIPALTKEQADVLARFASGMDIDKIVTHTGVDRDTVSGIITRFAGMNRQRAGNLVREHETARRNNTLAPRPPAAGDPAVTVTIEGLLEAADATGVARIERLANRIRTTLDELRDLVTAHAKDAHLREEAEKLRARLDQIAAELRTTNGPRPTSAGGHDSKAVRAWAEEAGVECPARGRIPAHVLLAYQRARTVARDG